MPTNYQPPPTYALPVIVDEKTGRSTFNPIWLRWFLDLTKILGAAGASGGSIQHNLLGGLQGGIINEFYHLTAAEHSALGVVDGASSIIAQHVFGG